MYSDTRTSPLSKRITFFDILLICLLTVLSFSPLIVRRPGAGENPHAVEIVTSTSPVHSLSLEHDGQYRARGPLGETVIEIAHKRVRIIKSSCATKVCVREGWKDKTGQMILCAPNRVGVFLKNDSENLDAVTR